MVHHRFNETEPNPNPHINFITALPMPESEGSRQLLRALAAQVRPVMKAHGFTVNSFEEYEYNAVFAGRNWNNGETIELVLRRANGLYCPTSWLMSTLCHELAHIKHMNHGPSFQALWARLRKEVRQLQDKGYHGDGYWSSGNRLADSARIYGNGIETGDFPEYICGGAQTRTRPTARRRKPGARRSQNITPSLHTGRQTAKRRKAGGRVSSKFAFVGAGNLLTDDAQSSKGKRAASNRAREERILAAEKRLNSSNLMRGVSPSDHKPHEEDSESDSDLEIIQETDVERRQALEESKKAHTGEDDHSLGKGLGWKDFEHDFNFSVSDSGSSSSQSDVIDLTGISDPNTEDCDLPTCSGSTFTSSKSEGKKKQDRPAGQPTTQISSMGKSEKRTGLGLVKSEVELRALTMKDRHRGLGQPPKVNLPRQAHMGSSPSTRNIDFHPIGEWDCLVCTLKNQPEHLACAACATPVGESTYHIK